MNSYRFINDDYTPMSEELWLAPMTHPGPQLTFIRHECPFCGAAYLPEASPLNLLDVSYQQTPNGLAPMPGSIHQCPGCFMPISNSPWMETPNEKELRLPNMGNPMPFRLAAPCIVDERGIIFYPEYDAVTNEAMMPMDACPDQHRVSGDSMNNSPSVDGIFPLVDYSNLQALQQASRDVASTLSYQENDKLLSAQLPSQTAQIKPWQTPMKQSVPPPPPPPLILPSSGQISRPNLKSTGLSDAPDLYADLRQTQTLPDAEYMNPKDSDMIPREQELQSENDLYTPRWVRGHGDNREGWCGICKPG
ncbi:meiotic expression up-regulated 26 [Fusarium globosum]|uniref:Meiotic expression up-regulated 26 n=1 Tax=Fusarium globosum TaxID=78864 RepID=A0A8H6DCR3_9HYPO|nr:meiotic expression up-regulated 26 [Fusarium globosum]